MRRALLTTMTSAALLGSLLAGATASAAERAPAWSLTSLAAPTHFTPGGETGAFEGLEGPYYRVEATNIGAAPTDGSPIVLSDTLPAGLLVEDVALIVREGPGQSVDRGDACTEAEAGARVTVRCEVHEGLAETSEAAVLHSSERLLLKIDVEVPAEVTGALESEVAIEGGGAAPLAETFENRASAESPPAGLTSFRAEATDVDGTPVTAAAAHPFDYATTFAVNTEVAPEGTPAPLLAVGGDTKDIEVELPPGLIGNPTAVPRCTQRQFTTLEAFTVGSANFYLNECPDSSAVGTISIAQTEGVSPQNNKLAAVFNLVPPPGMPAQLGFQVVGLPVYFDTELRSGSDYGVTARIRNVNQTQRVTAATVTLWGNPADPAHDAQRGLCAESARFLRDMCPAEVPEALPFLRVPTSCSQPPRASMAFDTWSQPGVRLASAHTGPALGACAAVPFDPSISAQPSTDDADAPSGLDFNLHIPQPQDPEGLAAADLRDATVTLPEGFVVNPASAGGLGACSPGEIGLRSDVGESPARFDADPADCPDAAKIGTAEVRTPLIDHPLPGAVYLAEQEDNPFGSLLALYIVVHDPETGIVVKLAGEVKPDPDTGRLSTVVENNPQTPFEDFDLEFFEGSRAPLRTPGCGAHTTRAELVPHSAPAGETRRPSDRFEIEDGCSSGALAPRMAAGLDAPVAGAHSPLRLRLTRPDGSDELAGVSVVNPQGLSATLAGVPYCPEPLIARAASHGGPGEGSEEKGSPSCPAASRVGSVLAGAGVGPSPFYTSGPLYLAGPYKGAPLSFLAVIPAVAGPFDLGAVTTRIALHVNPRTAQVSAVSDPLPTILAGIPLAVRDIRVNVDRPGFALAPTSCEPSAIAAMVTGKGGGAVPLANRFQVGGCRALGFKPKIGLRLFGKTKRASYQGLRAVVRARPGDANIGRTVVRMPRSAFLAQEHIRTICTRVQWAADACPKGAIYGRAIAWSPLLGYPLKGDVYLRSSDNTLPDLVADLRGPAHQPIRVELVGRTDSVKGALRNTFDVVPDAPVSYFRLNLFGGNKGLIVNSKDICRGKNRAAVAMKAHNGRREVLRPLLRNARCAKKGKRRGKGKGKHRRKRGMARGGATRSAWSVRGGEVAR